jgi:toxic protein SymE
MEKLKKKKVYTKFRNRTNDTICIPEIRLEGKWLEKLGFKVGSEIVIQPEENKLTIMILK